MRGNSAIGQYLSGALKYQSNPANFLYNANQVAYNPDSTRLGISSNFLQGDAAPATLDAPVKNVPTWTILLSQLPAPTSINDVTGTGYHVTIDGYGTNGVGPTGVVGGIGAASNPTADDGKVSIASLGTDMTAGSTASGDAQATQDQSTAAALPTPTLANGLPGATNFVPNNNDPDPVRKINACYYDGTLSATGTTTSSTAVAVDHFSITGGGAKLTVNPGGALVALMEIDQATGLVTNNGTVTTLGDYFLLSGGIRGTAGSTRASSPAPRT